MKESIIVKQFMREVCLANVSSDDNVVGLLPLVQKMLLMTMQVTLPNPFKLQA
jgi:hypothetical protein